MIFRNQADVTAAPVSILAWSSLFFQTVIRLCLTARSGVHCRLWGYFQRNCLSCRVKLLAQLGNFSLNSHIESGSCWHSDTLVCNMLPVASLEDYVAILQCQSKTKPYTSMISHRSDVVGGMEPGLGLEHTLSHSCRCCRRRLLHALRPLHLEYVFTAAPITRCPFFVLLLSVVSPPRPPISAPVSADVQGKAKGFPWWPLVSSWSSGSLSIIAVVIARTSWSLLRRSLTSFTYGDEVAFPWHYGGGVCHQLLYSR